MQENLSIKEKLVLASLVEKNGNNWSFISRMAKQYSEPGRSLEWLNPNHCAQEYELLSELINVNMLLNFKKTGDNPSREHEIIKILTDKRQEELMTLIEEETNRYM
ncbi:unnamed protein product [Gordionus sp. m RMFG-2023]